MDFFASAVRVAHEIVSETLVPGDVAVDATAGNGHDTVFLCRAVGADGHVYAFDVQQQALDATSARLASDNLTAHATLVLDAHERMHEHVRSDAGVGAVMFNLGYLPGSDRSIVTSPEGTIAALEAATRLLRPGGVSTVVVYTGHAGGAEEAARVEQFAASLPADAFKAMLLRPLNTRGNPPYVVGIRRLEP